MRTPRKAKPADGLVPSGEAGKLRVAQQADENMGQTMARLTLDPQLRNANLAMAFGAEVFGDRRRPDIMESSAALANEMRQTLAGDMALATRVYTAQAISLDALFTEMARRSGNNLAEYPDAADRYMRLALKAQAACRSTLEALTRLHQPREQTVRHVHVNEGGQAVVAGHFHHHVGVAENVELSKQSHAMVQPERQHNA